MKDVALVLSSGGPRGFAYIGAIEELLSRGYNITSIAGCSIGSLIGGIYAAGKLEEVKEWLFSLDNWKVFKLMDLAISGSYLVKGEKVISALKEIVPDINIEDLEIPFKAVATDLYTGQEVVFEKGKLFEAVRASISIPSLFRPVKRGMQVLIDGGIANPIPLNRVQRNGHDILVAFNVNDVDVEEIHQLVLEEANAEKEKQAAEEELKTENKAFVDYILHNDSLSLVEKMKMAGKYSHKVLMKKLEKDPKTENDFDPDANYYTILSRCFSLMNYSNTNLMLQLCPCDVLVNMPFDAFYEIQDYAKAEEISEIGRNLMREALDKYEGRQ